MFERIMEKFILLQLKKLEDLSKGMSITDNLSIIDKATIDLQNREILHKAFRVEWVLSVCKRLVQ